MVLTWLVCSQLAQFLQFTTVGFEKVLPGAAEPVQLEGTGSQEKSRSAAWLGHLQGSGSYHRSTVLDLVLNLSGLPLICVSEKESLRP